MKPAIRVECLSKRYHVGATPAGSLKLRRVFYRADRLRPPRAAVPVALLAPNDGWCDDPTHRDYNRPVMLPFGSRHEEPWRRDGLYDVVVPLGWNDDPVERRRGSAIFLHADKGSATNGCISLPRPELLRVLHWLRPGATIRVELR